MFFCIAFIGGMLRVWGLQDLELSYFDEAAYALEAAKMFGFEPSVDYYYARPGYIFWIGLSRLIFGDPLMSARLVGVGAYFLFAYLCAFPLKRIAGARTALLSLLFFSFSGLAVYYSRLILPDSVVPVFLFGAILLYVYGVETNKIGVLMMSGILLGFSIVMGSYRIAPTIVILGLVAIWDVYKSRMTKVKAIFLVALMAIVVVSWFDYKFSFFSQIIKVLKDGTFTRDQNIPKVLIDPFFFLVVIVASTGFVVVALGVIVDRFIGAKGGQDKGENRLLVQMSWALILTPLVFHTIYYLRAPKVISISLPAMAFLAAIATARVRSSAVKIGMVSSFLILGFSQCFLFISGMGLRGSGSLYQRISKLEGIVAYSNAPSVLVSVPIDVNRTKLVLGWDCAWIKVACNPDIRILNREAFLRMPVEERSQWQLKEEWPLRYTLWGNLFRILESFDSTPKVSWRDLSPDRLVDSDVGVGLYEKIK